MWIGPSAAGPGRPSKPKQGGSCSLPNLHSEDRSKCSGSGSSRREDNNKSSGLQGNSKASNSKAVPGWDRTKSNSQLKEASRDFRPIKDRCDAAAKVFERFGYTGRKPPKLEAVLKSMRRPLSACSNLHEEPWRRGVARLRGQAQQRIMAVDPRRVPSWNFRHGPPAPGQHLSKEDLSHFTKDEGHSTMNVTPVSHFTKKVAHELTERVLTEMNPTVDRDVSQVLD